MLQPLRVLQLLSMLRPLTSPPPPLPCYNPLPRYTPLPGWHIHSGYSCDPLANSPGDAVGGHYYNAASTDPWSAVTYNSTASGAADISLTMDGFSVDVQDQLPVFGRTVVVHSAAAGRPRVGCGVIGGSFQVTRAHVSTARYPGYPDNVQVLQPHMVAHLSETGGMLSLTATITGIEPSATGGNPPPPYTPPLPLHPSTPLVVCALGSFLDRWRRAAGRVAHHTHPTLPYVHRWQGGTSTLDTRANPASTANPVPLTPTRRWAATTSPTWALWTRGRTR
eukprot:scaffold39267_cov43-Phaeocystis_antarctica.AAC.1